MTYKQVIQELEALSIMPKTMPGLEKLKKAISHKSWYLTLDPQKIITVAGTNGKGTTCATLETLLLSAHQSVGLFTSPHLISTTERIRVNSKNISENDFIHLYNENKKIITECELTHFESLTLMAADFFFAQNNLDFVIFEVGLGGTYDATNVFPNHYSVITALGLDHQNILGNSIQEIAANKFGIIKNNSKVIHHKLPVQVEEIFKSILIKTKSVNIESHAGAIQTVKSFDPEWTLKTQYGDTQINIPGRRACENIMTAITVFETLGFDPKQHLHSLEKINWHGRMEKIKWPSLDCSLFLSGDHNQQGIDSLIELLQAYEWNTLHIVVGIGVDKDADQILNKLFQLNNVKIYLTKTPFKGRSLNEYSKEHLDKSTGRNENVIEILNSLIVAPQDMVLVTGSLYLVGLVLSEMKN